MLRTKKFILVLSLVLASIGYGAKTQRDTLTIAPENGHDQFNWAFDHATKTIDMVMYRLTDPDNVQHLLAAKARGVAIRVIVDQKGITGAAIEAFNSLKAAGVQIVPSSSAFSITHEKAAVFDSNFAIISTINLTRTGTYSRDYGILTFEPLVIGEMQTVFEADWENAKNNGKVTPPLKVGRLLWSPVNSKNKIMALINTAKKSVLVEVENLGEKDVMETLKAKAKSGVTVVVISPACLPGDDMAAAKRNVPILQDLQAGGVQAVGNIPPYSPENPYVHAKAIVVDNFWFYVGSENFSNNSLNFARELGLVEGDSQISNQLSNVIQIDFKKSQKASELSSLDCTHAFDLVRPPTGPTVHGPDSAPATTNYFSFLNYNL